MVCRWLCVIANVLAVASGVAMASPGQDWRVRGALVALEVEEVGGLPLAMRTLAELQATSAFDRIVESGRAHLEDSESRAALAYALGALHTRPEISIPLLFEILRLEGYHGGSEACDAFARWRGSRAAETLATTQRWLAPTGVDVLSWHRCVGLWNQAGVDAVLALPLSERDWPALASAVLASERAGMASKMLARLRTASAPAQARGWIVGLGQLQVGSPEVMVELDRRADDPALREVAIAAIAKLLAVAPVNSVAEERLLRWRRDQHLLSDVAAGLIAASPKLQREWLAQIQRGALAECAATSHLLQGSGAVAPGIAQAIIEKLASTEAAVRDCAIALAGAIAMRTPTVIAPLITAMRRGEPPGAALAALLAAAAGSLIIDDLVAWYRSPGREDVVSDAIAQATFEPGSAERLRPALLAYAAGRDHARFIDQTGPALLAVGPLSATEALTLIERSYDGLRLTGDSVIALRFWAIVLSGGDSRAVLAARWLAVNSPPLGPLDSAAARTTLDTIMGVLALAPPRNVRNRATSSLRAILEDAPWVHGDSEFLRGLLSRLPVADPALAGSRAVIARRLAELAPRSPWLRRVCGWVVTAFGLHFPLWLALLFTVYPRSRFCQSAMLFNPLGRAVTGWGYTQLLILASARLRRRLFQPLVDDGRDAEVAAFDAASFYASIRVAPILRRANPQAPVELGEPVSWTTLLDDRGLVVIEGASGLGKSHVQKALLARAREDGRTCLFVRASECNAGVVKEIEDRLARSADHFVDSLIHRGAIELFIDGLNEAQPSGVAEIARFCERAVNARIVVTTQPMSWSCPRRARQMRLLPLQPHEFEAFLLAQWPTVASAEHGGQDGYRARVQGFLAQRAGAARDIAVLQNRIDLAFVSHLLARDQTPNIHALRKQVVDDAARAYEAAAPGGAFPLAALGAAALRVLESGHPVLATDGIDPVALAVLAERKLLLRRGDTSWLFRHDSITSYFVAQGCFAAWIGEDAVDPRALIPAHLASPRLLGVYLQLAESLAARAAEQLALAIREHGRISGDRTLEVAFQDVLDRR
jgi:hypothetical protein